MSTLCNLLHFFLLLPEAIFNNNVQQQQQCGGSPNRIFKKKEETLNLGSPQHSPRSATSTSSSCAKVQAVKRMLRLERKPWIIKFAGN